MQRNECKPGTEVIIRGKIKEDDGTDLHPIIVDIHGSKREEIRCLDPSQLEPARTKYDPARKYRKGDLVRITGFHGRLFGCGGNRELSKGSKIGTQIVLHEDEIPGGDVRLSDGFLLNMYNYLSVACIELVKPIEEIEAEHPYRVEEMNWSFLVTRGDSCIYTIWWKSGACPTSPYNKEEALRKAQELCDELNRKHQESLNA
jgi:hypothetical protein